MPTLSRGAELSIPWEATIVGTETVLSGIALTTSRLELSASIFNSFVYGEWSFTANASFFEESLLYIGCKIRFTFVTQIGKKDFYLSILSISNGPGGSTGLGYESTDLKGGSASTVAMLYSIKLVSPWYFDQIALSKAYRGSVSSIINTILSEELDSSFSNKAEIIQSIDNKNIIRYRTFMTPGKFIDLRLRPVVEGTRSSSCFIYTRLNDTFCVKDYNQMGIDTGFISIDTHNPLMSQYLTLQSEHPEQLFYPTSIIFDINNSGKLWWLANPGSLWYYRGVNGLVKSPGVEPELTPATTNEGSSTYIPVSKDKNMDNPSYLYTDENMDYYDDTYNRISNLYTKDLMDAQCIQLNGYPNMNIDIGMMSSLMLTLPNDRSKESLYNQKYIVTEISHVFKAHKGFTQVTLATPNMIYADKTKLNNYLRIS